MDNDTLAAVKTGNLTKLQKLLDDGIKVNAKDKKSRTLLQHAANNGQREIVKCLLQNGADVLKTTVLHLAVAKKANAMVDVILENITRDKLKKLLDMQTKKDGNTALHVAANSDCHVNTCTLLKYGANFEIKNHADKKPVDLAKSDDIRELFKLIELSFAKAKRGDQRLQNDFAKSQSMDLTAVFNCRNNEGHTIMQALIMNEHYDMASNLLLGWRTSQPATSVFLMLSDPKRKKDVEKLTKTIEECREFWREKRGAIDTLMPTGTARHGSVAFQLLCDHAGKMGALALEKAHEVLLAYRRFEGKEKTLTTHPAMKNLEEVFEVLGFDPENIYVIVDEDACYWEKLPGKFKDNIGWLINLLNCIVDASILCTLKSIYTTQVFDAVKDDDLKKVQKLVKNGASVNGLKNNRTALCQAVERGNEIMVRFLLKSGAVVAFEGAIPPIYPAVDIGNANILKMLLEYVEAEELTNFVDCPKACGSTVLHHAARKGRLDIVKILLRYGATYWVFNEDNCTPLDVSTNDEVSSFLNVVGECFYDAKEADDDLIEKLKAMESDELLAVASTRNLEGQTLAVVAAKANAKDIARVILKMITEAKKTEK